MVARLNLLLLMLVWGLGGIAWGAGDIRLAIVATDRALEAPSDVLTASVSKEPGVTVLERAQIEKVWREQGLSALASNPIMLGQLLHADGVCLLELEHLGTNVAVGMRLVAVHPGVVLAHRQFPFPLVSPEEWARRTGQQLLAFLPKLSVLPKEAIPVSILNLRSAVNSREEQELERELTLLLYNRLMAQKEVFVLERRRLEHVADETTAAVGEPGQFWSGSYLLEGIINKAGLSQEQVTVSARVVPPGGLAKEMEVSGARTNLPALINELAGRILTTVKHGRAPGEWNPAAEANQYSQEAAWAFRWQMWREAIAASEASWALGKRDKDTATLRIRAYQQAAGGLAGCSVDHLSKYVSVSLREVSEDEPFGAIVRALELYDEGLHLFTLPDSQGDAEWWATGVNLLDQASGWLRYFYFTVEARQGQEDRLTTARELCREIAKALEAQRARAPAGVAGTLSQVIARQGAFWGETPEEGLQIYRGLLQAGQWSSVRSRFLNETYADRRWALLETSSRVTGSGAGEHADPASPCLVGWRWQDRQRWLPVWNGFVDELASATNPLVRLEGLYLRASYSWAEADYERNLAALLNYFTPQQPVVATNRLLEGWEADLRALVDSREETLDSACRQRIRQGLWATFSSELAKAKARQQRALWLETKKSYLTTQTGFDFFSFTKLVHQHYEPDEARQLLPLVADYGKRVGAGEPHSTATFWVNLLQQNLKNTISPPPLATNVVGRSTQPPMRPGSTPSRVPPGIRPLTESAAPPPLLFSNVLRAARFWRAPVAPADQGRWPEAPSVEEVVFREGQLWAQLRCRGRYQMLIVGIDPATLANEVVAVGPELGNPWVGRNFREVGFKLFEVYGGDVYVSTTRGLNRYSLKQKAWDPKPLPLEGRVWPSRVGDKVYLSTQDSLLSLNPDGQGTRVLASARRRPAMSVLDSVGDLGPTPVFCGAANEIRLVVSNRIWGLSAAAKDWTPVATIPDQIWHSQTCENGFLFIPSVMPAGPSIHGVLGGATVPELLLARTQPRPLGARGPMPHAPVGPPAKWPSPVALNLHNLCLESDPERLWGWAGDLVLDMSHPEHVGLLPENGRHGLIVVYDPRHEKPLITPVWLNLDVPAGFMRSEPARGFSEMTLFRATPVGLVVTRLGIPGFWLIPRVALDQRISGWEPSPRPGKSS